jgi:hypothetical protein
MMVLKFRQRLIVFFAVLWVRLASGFITEAPAKTPEDFNNALLVRFIGLD